MIVRKPTGPAALVRVAAMLILGLVAATPLAACGSPSKSTKSPQPSTESSTRATKDLDVDPIGGVVTVASPTSLKGASTATVTVTVSGFKPNMEVFAGECAHIKGLFICESSLHPPTKLTIDNEGKGSVRINVSRVFDGFVVAGDHWGKVDCTIYPCFIGVGNHTQGAGSGRLSFAS